MEKDYIYETLLAIRDLECVKENMKGVQKQKDVVAQTYDAKMNELLKSKKEALDPLEEQFKTLQKNDATLRETIVTNSSYLRECSYFDQRICPYIVKLMSLVEGIAFTYGIFGDRLVIRYNNEMIFESKNVDVLDFRIPFYLYYKVELDSPILVPNVDFKDYNYVRDYLDMLINYRIENNLRMFEPENDAEFEKMALTVMKDFISKSLDLIKEKQNKRVIEKQEEMDAIYGMIAEGNIEGQRK